MKEEYSIFRKYPTLEQVQEVQELLSEHGIHSILGDNVSSLDSTFGANTLNNEIEIRIKPSDFQKADKLLEQLAINLIDQVDEDYYLFDFTDEELFEILVQADEWNEFDYALAQKILKERGKEVNQEVITALKKTRLQELAKPEENQKPWIFAGYLFSILGGFVGLIIGYFLWTTKKTLPNGQKVYSYSVNDRMHGKFIFYIGLIIFPTTFLIRFLDLI